MRGIHCVINKKNLFINVIDCLYNHSQTLTYLCNNWNHQPLPHFSLNVKYKKWCATSFCRKIDLIGIFIPNK